MKILYADKNIENKALEYINENGIQFAEDSEIVILPAFCDVHVHFREPGFSYKETIETGCKAAAHGGYTTVCPMPNLKPVPDSLENLKAELDLIEKDASIEVVPYGAITVGEQGEVLADMEAMAPYVCAFSDDGKGVQSGEMMLSAMKKAKSLGKMIAAHCEVNALLNGGYIHDGEYAKAHGHAGICSESEYGQIARDVRLSKESGCSYHVCHISAKESVEIIRKAKSEGIDVSCETGPHYLVLCDEDLEEDGWFKMNPPLRSREDKAALIEGIKDGTIDMIATDHAPHSSEEKSKGLKGSNMGIVGLETAFALMYTELVKKSVISLERLVELMSTAPRKRFGLENKGDFTVFEVSKPYKIDNNNFLSMGKAMPFQGREVYGKCLLTVHEGKAVYSEV